MTIDRQCDPYFFPSLWPRMRKKDGLPGDGQQASKDHVSIILIRSRDCPSLVFRALYLEKYCKECN